MEESIQVEEATLVNDLSPSGATGRRLAEARQSLTEVTGWLNALSPAEQATPACYAANGTTLREKFRTLTADPNNRDPSAVSPAGCRATVL